MELISLASSTALISDIGSNVATTFTSISPFVAVSAGLALAIAFAPFVISILRKGVGNKKKD